MAGPGFIPVPDVMQLNLLFMRDNQQVENVFYVHMDGGVNDANLQAVATAAAQYVTSGNGIMPMLASNVIWQSAKTRDLTSDAGKSTESAINAGQVGGVAGPYLPNNVSLALHKTAVIGGRHNKGRTYVPGLSQSQLDGPNKLTAQWANDLALRYGGLIAAIENIAGAHFGFVSYRNNKQWLTEGVFVPVTSFQARDTILDSQRRRLPGRGI